MKTGKTARDEKASTIVDRSCVSCGEKPQEGKTHDAFFAAPHFRLSAEYGGAPDLIIRTMGMSYAAVVKLIGDENFSRKTAKIVANPKKGTTKTVGGNSTPRNQSKPSIRTKPQPKQQTVQPVDDIFSTPLDDLSDGDLAVADAEADHMANVVKIMTRQEAAIEDRETHSELDAALTHHREMSTTIAEGSVEEDYEPPRPTRKAIARLARKLRREASDLSQQPSYAAAVAAFNDKDPWHNGAARDKPAADDVSKPLEPLRDSVSQETHHALVGMVRHDPDLGVRSSRFYTAQDASATMPASSCGAAPPRLHYTGSEKRHLLRESRKVPSLEGEYLAFEAFSASTPPVAHACAIFEQTEFDTIVDSGTTVTIVPAGQHGPIDVRERIKIAGFDGHVSSSQGTLKNTVAFVRNRQGKGVAITLPKTHAIKGAPNSLLSVSAMVAAGYSFVFAPEGSFVTTPTLEIIDLVSRGGLYWLNFRRAKMPAATPARSQAPDFVVKNMAAGATVARSQEHPDNTSEDPCYCTSILEPGLLMPDIMDRTCACIPRAAELNTPGAFATSSPCANSFSARTASVSLQLMHRRLAHFNEQAVYHSCKQHSDGITLTDTPSKTCNCPVCFEAKQPKAAIPKVREAPPKRTSPFSTVYSDVKGKMAVQDFWGRKYFITFTSEVTRYTCVYFMKKTSEAKGLSRSWVG